jgi:hypothetical protein
MILVQGQTQLLEVVRAPYPASGLAHPLNRGDQQPNQHGDDRDHNQEFEKRKRLPWPHRPSLTRRISGGA